MNASSLKYYCEKQVKNLVEQIDLILDNDDIKHEAKQNLSSNKSGQINAYKDIISQVENGRFG